MSEKMNVEEATKALAGAKASERNHYENNATESRDLSMGVGIDPATVEKKLPESGDIPDVILLPKNKRLKKQNIPY